MNPVSYIFKDTQNHESGLWNRNPPKNCMQSILFGFKDRTSEVVSLKINHDWHDL